MWRGLAVGTALWAMAAHAEAAAPSQSQAAAERPALPLRVDGKPWLILGLQVNNSSGVPARTTKIVPTTTAMR